MNFEAVIGLEIHVQMKTKSKMFSSGPASFSHAPNVNVAPFDMAFPGTMPVVNKKAVINAIRVANALHMTIDHTLYFDRKNYFYSDLPKGFQITQQERPIGRDGYVFVNTPLGKKKIGIEEFLNLMETTLDDMFKEGSFCVPYSEGSVVSFMNDNATVKSTEYKEDGIYITARLRNRDYNKYEKYLL